MTATNHAIFGALTVAIVSNPVIGLPLALLSHFALDALPHFGAHTIADPKSREFKAILFVDGMLLTTFLCLVAFAGYRAGWHWWLLPLGGALGALPDLMWLKHYRNDLKGEDKSWDWLRKLHKRIQRWERSWGWVIESVWFILSLALLRYFIFSR